MQSDATNFSAEKGFQNRKSSGLAESLASDWRKAARLYARFGITEAMFRFGVPGSGIAMVEVIAERVGQA